MPQCSKCGGNTTIKAGISKKNGKPWTGFKCQDQQCGNMDFQNSNGTTRPQPQIKKTQISNENEILKLLLDIARRTDEIKALLEDLHPATKLFTGTKVNATEEPF